MADGHAEASGEPIIRPSTEDHPLYEPIQDACRTVHDPEIPVNIYDLGLIYDIRISDDGDVMIAMTLTSPGCPVAGTLPREVEDRVREVEDVATAAVELVWEPAWTPARMSEAARAVLNI